MFSNNNSKRLIDIENSKSLKNNDDHMYIIDRSGRKVPVSFDKITLRNKELSHDLNINTEKLSQKVIKGLKNGMTTKEIDILSSETSLYMSIESPDYEILAKRILISNMHKNTNSSIIDVTEKCSKYNVFDSDYLEFVRNNFKKLDEFLNFNRDYDFTCFGFKTLEKGYLLKDDINNIIERPQHLFLRVATFIRMPDLDKIKDVYDCMSLKYFTHATPTLFNAGLKESQLSSCFLLNMKDDLKDIMYTLAKASLISKFSGGLSINFGNIRSKGSKIKSLNGEASGILPLAKLWNDMARYINQGGKRKGSVAIYIHPHSPDLIDILKIKLNDSPTDIQCLDLHMGLMIPDLFMKRLKTGGKWSFFDSTKIDFSNLYGEEYEKLYLESEEKKLYTKQIDIKELWLNIISVQMETGEPYILFVDHINRKSNQMNRGKINSSNLCCEIVQYTDSENYAVCNLASISYPSFIEVVKDDRYIFHILTKDNCKWCDKSINFFNENSINYNIISNSDPSYLFVPESHKTFPAIVLEDKINNNYKFVGGYNDLIEYYNVYHVYKLRRFNFELLGKITELITENMDIIIDKNFYPVEEARNSNMEMRPIGIGGQGLADALQLLGYTWEDQEAKDLNRDIYATVYYFSAKKSMELAKKNGPYKYFKDSPTSKGILQFDMWNENNPTNVGGLLDWKWLKQEIVKNGIRNSLLTTQMPTGTTSQILGNNESFEPYTTNIYSRKVLSGSYPVYNKHMFTQLNNMGIWNDQISKKIIENRGSIQSIDGIPQRIKDIYKTAWELSSKLMIDYSRERGKYICQTQSFNVFMKEPTTSKLSTLFMMGWESGLKTGMYYLRRRPVVESIQFSLIKEEVSEKSEEIVESECLNCSA